MLETLERDAAARITKLSIGESTLTTPSILKIESDRFSYPSEKRYPELKLSYGNGKQYLGENPMSEVAEVYKGEKPSVVPWARASDIVDMKERAGYSAALYIPGPVNIEDYALMVYSGVDLFDVSNLIIMARKGNYLTDYGMVREKNWEIETCSCPACLNGKQNFENRFYHNYFAALRELAVVREFIRRGQLRHLVELRCRSKPENVALLRELDNRHYDFFRKRLSRTGGGVVGVSSNTLDSPYVRYYHELMEKYEKPEGEILTLLPCSARKPYSTSRSHRRFSSVISGYRNYVHEIIVTSPLGLVPRELESFYPARDYDISVTGTWSTAEKEMITGMLTRLLDENQYKKIINHTPYDFVSGFLEKYDAVDSVVNKRPTSTESMKELEDSVEKISCSVTPAATDELRFAAFRNMWRYQFGKNSSQVIQGLRVKGKFPFLKLFDEQQLAMFVPNIGRISLTLSGGELLKKLKINRVFIEDFKPRGDIFAVGIKSADEKILKGDEVVVIHREEIRGVGVAQMNSNEMVESNRGAGVKLRHKSSS